MSNMLEVLSQNVIIDKDKCIFCGKCVDVCVLDNLRLKLAPCKKACPMGLNCQGYVQLIARGEEEQALEVIREELPFPGILGRICHHPCESACKRNEVDGQGVAIRSLKRYVAQTQEFIVKEVKPENEKAQKVAIIGGGPAGMMAAYNLRQKGYKVYIFEAGSRLGGMLTSCIPEYRLPGKVVQEEAEILAKMGIEVTYNTTVGKDISMEKLQEEYDAIIVATGIQAGKKLGLIGEEAENVYNAIDFLRAVRRDEGQVSVGEKVTVIGGGNSAINAAQSAYRLGAKKINIVYRKELEKMRAHKSEIESALEEGIRVKCGLAPEKIILEDGKVKGIEFKSGNDERKYFDADTIIIAIGQEIDPQLDLGSDIEMKDGFIVCEPVTKQTNIEKIFAAGDITVGPKTVIDAMAQGRDAAESVHCFIQELPLDFDRNNLASCETEFEVDCSNAEPFPRVNLQKIEGKERTSFNELEKCLTKEQAMMEAKRCLSCGEPYGKFHTCWSCLPCEVECPQKALSIKIPYLMR